MTYIIPDDLALFASIDEDKAQEMIDDAMAQAILVAPCLADEDELTTHQKAAVKAILRRAVLRWNEVGVGGVTQQQRTAGPFSESQTVSTSTSRGLFWPSEIDQLQAICSAVTGGTSGAFTIDTAPSSGLHAEICALVFGANYCSCGASIAGHPLYELP